ncbi:MAG: Tryptophan synthase alpha chain [Labilithrix sp.]|nr:Tryptophan synthase alpha chain [Labilithrix sp.]
MLRRTIRLAAFVCIPLASVVACSHPILLAEGLDAPPSTFGAADSGGDGNANANAEASVPEVPMCPVTTCAEPWATCPASKFPCDANLLSDDQNCGGCGIRCLPYDRSTHSQWSCLEGRCVMGCSYGDGSSGGWRDCDADPTNGCEVDTRGNVNNCGDCGAKCPEGYTCVDAVCVELCLSNGLPDKCGTTCTDLRTDDNNCGTCGTVCPSVEPAKPTLPPDMRYGCGEKQCGAAKCNVADKANCNGDLSDGCEATLHTDQHCNGCDDACPAGQPCHYVFGTLYKCGCDDGETLCPGSRCRRTDDDVEHCGGCFRTCPGVGLSAWHFEATCTFGVCGGKCADGYADCDGRTDNGCEVNTRIDNRNCGGCEHACLPNQICSEGKCLVEPCDAGMGDPTK